MTLLIIYAFVSIFFSFLCSILEAVLLSITPTFINIKKKEGKDYAKNIEMLKKDVDKPLIAILTLNTIAHTVGAILVGVQAEQVFGNGDNSILIVSALMTLMILVLSEIIPKTIGATYWKNLANFTSKGLNILIFPLKYTGILWLLQLTTKLIGGKNSHVSTVSRDSFLAMTDIAHEEGVFQESESKVIKNLINFKKIVAKDIMTPRTIMVSEDEKTSVKTFFDENQELRVSRIPIYSSSPDNITGLVLKDDIYKEMALDNDDKTLADIKREIIIVERKLPIPILFEKLVESKNHMALVVDEYGTVTGLVTMEDVIETLLGLEIMDESDNIADLQKQARKSWEARAKRLGMLRGDNDVSNDES
ncbi:CBS domain containing-hemolysin-like protein [Gelidibacter algens]|jgi:CBS domain containing-hemolysin-like protein|uniref:CBS domain containing-hemolysin-like protein n=1 Tax=Gelidibacter algens TaxID=49280 RepID=A0A1A7QXU9_9FLAO|nr:CNNM domain-containing protein [Gelidibacter algens]OBX24840.1 hemolysin [Gelidibacter algens]RAJ24423.1 CBS domain containing-hemolysin-like protein [Gelidibacter algens]